MGRAAVAHPGDGGALAGGFMLLGGIGRLVSLAQHGAPHWFQIPLTVIELVLPPLYMSLAAAGERARQHVVATWP